MKRYGGGLRSLAVAAVLALAPVEAWAAAPPANTLVIDVAQAEAEVRRLQAEMRPLEAELAEKLAAVEAVRGRLVAAAEAVRLRQEAVWREALADLHGKRYDQAVAKFECYLKLETVPAKLGEVWYRLAEAHQRGGNAKSADQAFRKCIEHSGRFGYLARYELAKTMLEAGDVDNGEAALTHNLRLMRFEPDAEAQEKTLFALGGLLYERQNYREAVRRFGEALGRFRDNPESVRARFQLADSSQRIAAEENQNLLQGKHSPDRKEWITREYRRWLLKAATEFSDLATFLDSPKGKGHLTSEQRKQVPFSAAKCWFDLSEYAKALEIYEGLAARYPAKGGNQTGLEVLGHLLSCHAALGDRAKVRQYLLEVKEVLPEFPEEIRRQWGPWTRVRQYLLDDAPSRRWFE